MQQSDLLHMIKLKQDPMSLWNQLRHCQTESTTKWTLELELYCELNVNMEAAPPEDTAPLMEKPPTRLIPCSCVIQSKKNLRIGGKERKKQHAQRAACKIQVIKVDEGQ